MSKSNVLKRIVNEAKRRYAECGDADDFSYVVNADGSISFGTVNQIKWTPTGYAVSGPCTTPFLKKWAKKYEPHLSPDADPEEVYESLLERSTAYDTMADLVLLTNKFNYVLTDGEEVLASRFEQNKWIGYEARPLSAIKDSEAVKLKTFKMACDRLEAEFERKRIADREGAHLWGIVRVPKHIATTVALKSIEWANDRYGNSTGTYAKAATTSNNHRSFC